MKTKSRQEVKINYDLDCLQYGIIANNKIVALFVDERYRDYALDELETVFVDETFIKVDLK